MKIHGIIWLSGAMAVAVIAVAPDAYADSFGLSGTGNYYSTSPALSGDLTDPIAPVEIVGFSLSGDGYFVGFGKNLKGGSTGGGGAAGGAGGTGGGGSSTGTNTSFGTNGSSGGTGSAGNGSGGNGSGGNGSGSNGSSGGSGNSGNSGQGNGYGSAFLPVNTPGTFNQPVVTPEPTSLLLLGTGLAGLGLLRHRANRRSRNKSLGD